jgi:hypothetical protein
MRVAWNVSGRNVSDLNERKGLLVPGKERIATEDRSKDKAKIEAKNRRRERGGERTWVVEFRFTSQG